MDRLGGKRYNMERFVRRPGTAESPLFRVAGGGEIEAAVGHSKPDEQDRMMTAPRATCVEGNDIYISP